MPLKELSLAVTGTTSRTIYWTKEEIKQDPTTGLKPPRSTKTATKKNKFTDIFRINHPDVKDQTYINMKRPTEQERIKVVAWINS